MKRRWDDDVVFKNQARGTEDRNKKKEFVNVSFPPLVTIHSCILPVLLILFIGCTTIRLPQTFHE